MCHRQKIPLLSRKTKSHAALRPALATGDGIGEPQTDRACDRSQDAARPLGAKGYLSSVQHDGNGMTASPSACEPKPKLDFRVFEGQNVNYSPTRTEKNGIVNKRPNPFKGVMGDALFAGKGIPLGQATDHTCRWPLGKSATEGHQVCGQPTARGSYCQNHSEMAFVRISHRKPVSGEVPEIEKLS